MTDIVKLDPKEYGLEESKAADIAAQFKPMLDKMIELEKEYNEVIKLPIEDPATAKKAKEVRLKYVKVRTGTADIHKQQKAFYLAGGRFVDGWKNAQLFASQGIEEKLEEIEKYAERKEAERIAALQADRAQQLATYEVENIEQLQLGSMSESVWQNFLTGTKMNYEARKEAERKAEEERIERERKDAEEREAQRLENERLKKEAQEKAEIRRKREQELRLYIVLIRDYNGLLDAGEEEYQKQLSELKVGWDQYCEHEREKEERTKKEKEDAYRRQKEAEEKAEADRKERDRLAAELKAKQEAEEKAEAEKQAAIESELAKGDKEKFTSLLSDLAALKIKYTFKSKKHNQLSGSVNELIDKIINFAQPKL